LDDIIVHGKTEDEYLENLDKVLKALKYSNITANPKKIRSGMTQIE
jgi:predicted RNase H-like HicB family nuclease